MPRLHVTHGISRAAEAAGAVADLAIRVAQPGAALTLLFASPSYDLAARGRAIAPHFPGPVLALARPSDLVANLTRELAECRDREALAPFPFVGFSTYGEQFDGLHVNHTLTGVALGA